MQTTSTSAADRTVLLLILLLILYPIIILEMLIIIVSPQLASYIHVVLAVFRFGEITKKEWTDRIVRPEDLQALLG